MNLDMLMLSALKSWTEFSGFLPSMVAPILTMASKCGEPWGLKLRHSWWKI